MLTPKGWKYLNILVWSMFTGLLVLTFYVNWFMPHGKFYDTGDVNCPDYGQCEEVYKEDLRGVNIPSWAKALRNDGFFLPVVGLGIIGFYTNIKRNEGSKEPIQHSHD